MKHYTKWFLGTAAATIAMSCVMVPVHADDFDVKPGETPINLRVFKCGSTIVSFHEYKRQDGLYRFASWNDSKGQNYNIPMYVGDSIPDENTGEIVYTMLFMKSDSNGQGYGKGALFNIHHKSGAIDAHFTDLSGNKNKAGTYVYFETACVQTDYETYN